MLDDPKYIGGLMSAANLIPGLFLMAMPILTPIGFVACFFCPIRTDRVERYSFNAVLAALYISLCVIGIYFLRADFGRVVEWWFD